MVKHISCNCKYKFSSTTCNSNQTWNNNKCQCECKKYRTCKKIYSWKPSTCICENSKRLKYIVDDSVIACDEIIYVTGIDCISKYDKYYITNYANKLRYKKIRYKMDCYILHTVLLVTIVLFIIAIICCYYVKHRPKLRKNCLTVNMKIKNHEFKKVYIKNRTCYYFDDIIKFEDFDFDNILIDEKSYENVLVCDNSYETLIAPKPLRIRLNKVYCFVRIMEVYI